MSFCLCSIFLELESVFEFLLHVFDFLFGLFPLLSVLVTHLSVLRDSSLVHFVISLKISELGEEDTLVSVGVNFIASHGQEVIDLVSQLAWTSDNLENVVGRWAVGGEVVSDEASFQAVDVSSENSYSLFT